MPFKASNLAPLPLESSLHSVARSINSPPPSGAGRLDFLDGMRGLAAFYVVFHHLFQIYLSDSVLPAAEYYRFTPIMHFGHHAVAVFIVLSGFCLMMPVARSAAGALREGFTQYMWRRIRRIVPAYYAAILISLILVACIPVMRKPDGEFWGPAFAAAPADWHSYFDIPNLVAHLLLLHAIRADWVLRIDPPMWSIGVEWLNYFLMPLLFIPVWRKLGNLAMVLFATGFCFLPYLTRPALGTDRFTFHWMQPWFIALFAFGMAAASLQFPRSGRQPTRLDSFLRKLALHPVMLILMLAAAFVCRRHRVPTDFVTGVLTVCIILHCASNTVIGRRARFLLECRPAVWLGMISYSLYLFHGPLLQLAHRLLEPLGLSGRDRLIAMCFVIVPVIIFASWIAYRLFEKPFLARTQRVNPANSSPTPARVTQSHVQPTIA